MKKSTADALFVLCVGKEKTQVETFSTRVGFVVSKKIHKRAVKRNRIKRLAREAYRAALKNNDIPSSQKWVSLIFTARGAALDADYHQVYNSVVALINRVNKKFCNEKTCTPSN